MSIPHCECTEQQVKVGLNQSDSQRRRCKSCQRKYTPDTKSQWYDRQTREHAVRLYVEEHIEPDFQAMVDRSLQALRYFSDAFGVYAQMIYDRGHYNVRTDKRQTYSVEADNAELRTVSSNLCKWS